MPLETPPSPSGSFLFGNAFQFTSDPLGSLERWHRELGDVYEISAPGRTLIVVCDPELIRQVIEKDADKFTVSQTQMDAFSGIEANALVVLSDERWKTMRNLMQRYFTPSAVEEYPDDILRETDRQIDEWEVGDRLDINDEMSTLTIRIVARCLLDYSIEGQEEVIKDAADGLINQADVTNTLRIVPEWIPIPQNVSFRHARSRIRDLVHEIIDQKRHDLGSDLLSAMVEANEEGEITYEELRDNTISFFLAGSDTTSAGLTYLFFCLGNNHDSRSSFLSRVYDLCGGELDPSVIYQDDTIRNYVEEALRLYPPAFSISRRVTDDYQLGEYRIPEGAEVILPQWVTHHRGGLFEDPYEYRPSRWENGRDRPKFASFPFGGGDRFCIGSHFAMMEMPIITARIFRRVEFEMETESIDEFVPSATLRPGHPIEVTIKTIN